MSIEKYWEIGCDNCGCAEHFANCSKEEAERQFREPHGGSRGIITRDGRHFCSAMCRGGKRIEESEAPNDSE